MTTFKPGQRVRCTHMPLHYFGRLTVDKIYTIDEIKPNGWIAVVVGGSNIYELQYFTPCPIVSKRRQLCSTL